MSDPIVPTPGVVPPTPGVVPPAPHISPTAPPPRGARAFWTGRWGFLVAGLVVGALIGGGIGSVAKTSTVAAGPTPSPVVSTSLGPAPVVTTPSPVESFTFSAPPAANTDARYTSSCDYVLGDFSSKTRTGYRFVAGATLHNRGNVGVVVQVVATWKQLGSAPIVQKKVVKLPYHASKDVGFTYLADQNEIDLIQAVQQGGTDCFVKATITDQFGIVH